MRLVRNITNHFSKAGVSKNIQRTAFHRPFTHTTTMNSGKLIPFFMDEAIPGETFDAASVRLNALSNTPLVPVMDTAFIDYFFFFIPIRLVWENFREFMGENTRGAWDTNLPQRQIPQKDLGTLTDHHNNACYLGLPMGLPLGKCSVLPFRSIRHVWNDWFRVQALQDPLMINKGDSDPDYSVGPQNLDLLPVAKFPDYFTTALPSPQYGEAVSIGLTGDIPVEAIAGKYTPGYGGSSWEISSGITTPGVNADYLMYGSVDEFDVAQNRYLGFSSVSQGANLGSDFSETSFSNIWAKGSEVGAVSINDLRIAFQIQKYKEAQARGGTRYTEILESIWNVSSPDSRLQRTEYIGGDRVLVNMQQVLQTSSSDAESPQGFAAGFSRTTTAGGRIQYAVPEHGLIMGFMCIRPTHTYQQGIDRFWKKKDVMDFYNPYLANIGEQPVYTYEIYADSDEETVFGYQEAWADYRWKRSYVSGEMFSASPNSRDIYHYADFYSEAPTLSGSWIEEDPNLIDRTLAVDSDVADQFKVDIFVDLRSPRPLPAHSTPGLIDHA